MPREEFNARGGDEAAELARLGAAATGLPPSTAQSVQLLIDGAAKYASLLQAIATAREHIHVEYYICHPDSTGNALPDALVATARAGVRVRLLLHAVGSAKATRSLLPPLLAAGGELASLHPACIGRLLTPHRVNMLYDPQI